MHYEWLDAYLLSFPGVEKDYQPVWQWFRQLPPDVFGQLLHRQGV